MAATGQFQAILKAPESITDAGEVRKEAELLLKPDAKWEELFVPAAISVGILGELACNSMRQKYDVSINKNCPRGGFKSITHPDSFKACLQQISAQAWDVFKEVFQIHKYSKFVSKKMTKIMQGFFQNAHVEQNQLLTQTNQIQNEAKKCKESAQTMKGKFSEMISLVQELSQICQNARCCYEKDLNDEQMALEQAKINEKSVIKELENARQKQMQAKGEVKEAFKEFWQAANFSPTSWYDGSSEVSDKIKLLNKLLSKVEEGGEALRLSHKEDKRSFENVIEQMKKLRDILCEIKDLEMREKDSERSKMMLMEGQDALEKVEQQWVKMVQFFHVVSNLIDFCFNWHIEKCLASAEGIEQVTHAFNASNVAQLVRVLCKIFTKAHKKCIVTLYLSISGILKKEPSDPGFAFECDKVKNGCAEAKTATSNVVLEWKNEFKKSFSASTAKMKAMQHS